MSSVSSAPSSLEDAAAYLAGAHAEGRHVRIGDDLRTEGLDRVLEHEAGDLTCTVEAGVRLSVLRAALAPRGQRLSLDPPGDPTVGACLAANLSGPLRHRFGAPRDLVLGVTLVLADGTVANAGGKVVKNVAGYDLGKLVCGSRGTSGADRARVAAVASRSRPSRELSSSRLAAAAGVVRALHGSQLQPNALDVLHPGRVAVLFEGSAAGVADQLRRAIDLVGGEETGDDIWSEARERQGAARGRLRFDPGRLDRTLAALGEAVVRPSAGVAYVPHETEDDTPGSARALNERIRAQFDPDSILSRP